MNTPTGSSGRLSPILLGTQTLGDLVGSDQIRNMLIPSMRELELERRCGSLQLQLGVAQERLNYWQPRLKPLVEQAKKAEALENERVALLARIRDLEVYQRMWFWLKADMSWRQILDETLPDERSDWAHFIDGGPLHRN